MLGSLILYLKGMRIMMFQLSGFYCRVLGDRVSDFGVYRGLGKVWGLGFRAMVSE